MAAKGRTLMQERGRQRQPKRRQRARLAAGQKTTLTQQTRVVRVTMVLLGMRRKQQQSSGGSVP
jgi:hypothetical protein